MALNVIEGLMGAGKSYVAVNKILVDFLKQTKRPIVTNLPLEVDNLVAFAAKSPAMQEEYRKRIIFIEPGMDDVPEHIQKAWKEQEHEELKDGTRRDRLKEFWWWCPANAVVMLDETADLWNAKDFKQRPKSLNTFINHHRHYLMDLYLFAQSREDLDVQLRRKFQYVWQVRNSLKENIIEHWLFNGMRWPFQFFFLRQYTATEIWGKLQKKGDNFVRPLEVHHVWPTKRGFANYRSFSAASTLPGMKLAGQSATSEDYEPSLVKRLLKQIPKFVTPLLYLGGLIGFGVGGWYGIQALLHSSETVATVRTSEGAKITTSSGGANEQAVQVSTPGQTNSVVVAANQEMAQEKVTMQTPVWIQTNTRRIHRGHRFPDGTQLAAILLDGFITSDGKQHPTSELFSLLGEQSEGGGPSGSGGDFLRDLGPTGPVDSGQDGNGNTVRGNSGTNPGSDGLSPGQRVSERQATADLALRREGGR
jgi:hypothetical protein